MRWIVSTLFALSLALASTAMMAEPLPYKEVDPPAPTDSGDQIEVLEFFSYGCSHCYDFDPHLEAWLESKPDNVVFRRIAVPLNKKWEPLSYFFYTAEIMGVLDKVHKPLFGALQTEKRKLYDKQSLIKFAAEQGVDEAEFRKTWDSFAVALKVDRSRQLANRYQARGVPMMGVNGKYLTGGRLAGSYPDVIEVVNQLIVKEGG